MECLHRAAIKTNFYAKGFIEAAYDLLDLVVREKRWTQRDTLIMPVLYNVRHGLELYLKLYIQILSYVGVLKPFPKLNHDIEMYFSHLITNFLPDVCLRENMLLLKPFIESPSKIDADGQELRYFTNRDGNRSLASEFLINIAHVRLSIASLKEILDCLYYRVLSFQDERNTGSFTNKLSRSHLYTIVDMLPPMDAWCN